MYQPTAGTKSVGVHLVTLGFVPFFKPWFFDGAIVFWGAPCQTHSAALEAAEILRATCQ